MGRSLGGIVASYGLPILKRNTCRLAVRADDWRQRTLLQLNHHATLLRLRLERVVLQSPPLEPGGAIYSPAPCDRRGPSRHYRLAYANPWATEYRDSRYQPDRHPQNTAAGNARADPAGD